MNNNNGNPDEYRFARRDRGRLAATVAYLPLTFGAMNVFTAIAFALSVVISSAYSYCHVNAVHVVPGTMLLCVAVWLPRARGHNRSVPAAMMFALTFIAVFPVDIYGAYTCHAANGFARIGGARLADALVRTPLALAVVHTSTTSANATKPVQFHYSPSCVASSRSLPERWSNPLAQHSW
ncbi:hypothetical protein AB4Y42_42385 [Paraburkholderia sp. EG286B]|uniref:hypothetical protein n=1 Tax=Paraburkholderia sp. EG286B TaxID=3237011 RepID=UPI0034D32FD9